MSHGIHRLMVLAQRCPDLPSRLQPQALGSLLPFPPGVWVVVPSMVPLLCLSSPGAALPPSP
ncbi:hypothetical protein NDU88_001391, partial [Pleurodeles waltl]